LTTCHDLGTGTHQFQSKEKEIKEKAGRQGSYRDPSPFGCRMNTAGFKDFLPSGVGYVFFEFEIIITEMNRARGTILARRDLLVDFVLVVVGLLLFVVMESVCVCVRERERMKTMSRKDRKKKKIAFVLNKKGVNQSNTTLHRAYRCFWFFYKTQTSQQQRFSFHLSRHRNRLIWNVPFLIKSF
jgi:hypothetical protein